jgi:hypothetical protein
MEAKAKAKAAVAATAAGIVGSRTESVWADVNDCFRTLADDYSGWHESIRRDLDRGWTVGLP